MRLRGGWTRFRGVDEIERGMNIKKRTRGRKRSNKKGSSTMVRNTYALPENGLPLCSLLGLPRPL